MIIVWSPEAIDDLAALRAYIAEQDPDAALRTALHILHNVEMLLPANPQMGRPGRVPGTRELVIPRTLFIVPYRVENIEAWPAPTVGTRQAQTIQVLRVYHGARRWPDKF